MKIRVHTQKNYENTFYILYEQFEHLTMNILLNYGTLTKDFAAHNALT